MATFERFERSLHSKRGPDPVVSVNANGAITLNRAADEALGTPEHVTFHYDEEAKVAALRASDAQDKDSYKVTRGKRQTALIGGGRRFTDYYGIPRKQRYKARMEDGYLQFSVAP